MIPESVGANVSDEVRDAINWALLHIDVCEDPPGSNRGPEIDAWCKAFGSPLGSYWCALAVGMARKFGKLWIPSRDVGSCDEWVYQATSQGLVTHTPTPGAVVVYTNHKTIPSGRYAGQHDAVHMGLVTRVTPKLHAVEGNTTLGKYDRNGYVQTLKDVDTSRVLCYIAPKGVL